MMAVVKNDTIFLREGGVREYIVTKMCILNLGAHGVYVFLFIL
jgi:hypothetical protein